MKPNLILSGVHSLEYEQIKLFLDSLFATGTKAHVHLFLGNTTEETQRKLHDRGVTTENFRYFHIRTRRPPLIYWPFWRNMFRRRDFDAKLRLARPILSYFVLRHGFHHDFLRREGHKYENVLWSDCRDLVYQRDPFSDNLGPGLHCFQEARTETIGSNANNWGKIERVFGKETAKELAHFPVTCSGTVMGDVASMLPYSKAMFELLVTNNWSFYDQGVHNYIVHKKVVPNVILHDNYTSTVFTGGCEPVDEFRWNDQNEIVRDDGLPYPVLHQCDRYPDVLRRYTAKIEEKLAAGAPEIAADMVSATR